MAENRKAGQGFYYFSRVQLLALAVGFAATSVVVFLLGIMIGQRIEEGKLLKRNEEPLVRIPIEPLSKGTASAPSPAKEEMTFYDTLAKSPAAERPASKPAKAAVKETRSPAPVALSEAPARSEEIPSPAKAGAAPEAKKEAPAKKAPGSEAAESAPGPRVWTVQVNAYSQERDAKGLAKKLKDKGYDAYVVPNKGNTWHRVRVGRLETREEARQLQETLKTKENFSKAIAVSR